MLERYLISLVIAGRFDEALFLDEDELLGVKGGWFSDKGWVSFIVSFSS